MSSRWLAVWQAACLLPPADFLQWAGTKRKKLGHLASCFARSVRRDHLQPRSQMLAVFAARTSLFSTVELWEESCALTNNPSLVVMSVVMFLVAKRRELRTAVEFTDWQASSLMCVAQFAGVVGPNITPLVGSGYTFAKLLCVVSGIWNLTCPILHGK